MKRLFLSTAVLAIVVLAGTITAAGAYQVSYNFNTTWSGDYAPGWENSAYRHGPPPVGKMMEQVAGGRNGTAGMKLVADSTPESWMWWAAVNPTGIDAGAMTKQYDPYVSAWYYDTGWESGSLHAAGQIYAVPSWVNPYIPSETLGGPGEDWTDVQFGARMNQATPADNYYYVAAGENSPGWQDTNVDRAIGWVNIKMQLSSADGYIHFYVDGVERGMSYRHDYVDLGDVGLYTMFTDPLSDWGSKPYTVWDDVQVGSNAPVPEPMSIMLGIMGLGSVAGFRKLRRK